MEAAPFSCTGKLKNNVKFWIRIYTELSQDQGLLHDSEFPLIVYETVKPEESRERVGPQSGESQEGDYLRHHKVRTGKEVPGCN
jgi:hypothetical protein